MTARSAYLGLVALLCACAGTPQQVVGVARSDLGCDQVEITKVADNRYVGVGCGHVRTYAELCGPGGCSWVRFRDDDAASSGGVAQGSYQGSNVPAPPRDIVQAPPPAQREIIQAPPPAQAEPRQVIPAPPPAASESGSAPADPNATSAPQSFTPEATPLSQGELSTPYQTEVPAEPVVQRVAVAPPVALIEDRPLPPAPSYVWVSGYWWWNTPRWVWVTGYWCPPRRGYAYVPGSWYWSSNYWWYGPGGWARPGSTFIAYRLPPRSNRVIVTRDFAPHRATALGAAPLRGSQLGLSRAPAHVGSPGHAPRGFSPQGSSLYRYPSHLGSSHSGRSSYGGSQPSRAPSRAYGTGSAQSSYPRALSPAPAPRHSQGGVLHGGGPAPSRAYSTPGASPSRSYSTPSAAPGRSFSSPRSMPQRGGMFSGGGSRGSSAPLRAPSHAPVQRGGSHVRGR